MKKLKISLMTLLSLLITVNIGKSQCTGIVPTTNSSIAKPTSTSSGCSATTAITTTSHTGTDAYYDGFNHVVVNVWDESNASFSWKYFGSNSGSIAFAAISALNGATLVDPDVVIQEYSGGIYSMFVGIVSGGSVSGNVDKVAWVVYKWNSGSSAFAYITSGFLGDVTNNGKCVNPNIDVNASGKVAITWSQQTLITLTLTVSPAPYAFGPSPISYLRAGVFAAYGTINGTNCSGTSTVSDLSGGSVGDFISTPTSIDHIFEANINPDVCVAENGDITFTYLQTWFDASQFPTLVGRVIAKIYKTNCSLANPFVYTFNANGITGFPRIAARPDVNHADDFEVVMGYHTLNCSCTIPCSYSSAILNWGVYNGSVSIPSGGSSMAPYDPFILTVTSTPSCDISSFFNDDPVVTYLPTTNPINNSVAGDYCVAWTHGADYAGNVGISNTVLKDIVARTYNQGLPQVNDFSIVNKYASGCNTTDQDWDQTIPSISGRYMNARLNACFYDQDQNNVFYIGYKLTTTNGLPGRAIGGALRVANNIETGGNVTTSLSGFKAIPNPFKNEISFEFSLAPDENPVSIEISDSRGAVVKKINIEESKTTQNWKPTNLNPGIYFVKLITSEGEYFTKISKEK